MDKRLVTVVLMAVLVALVITAVFYQITVGRKPAQAEVATRELVVAKRDLPMGAVVTAEDARVIDFPEQAYPANAFSNIEDVIDRSVVHPILANEPIITGRVTEKGAGFGLAPLIPDGMRAVAIAINQVSGVSGFILPGSKVDVLLTGSPSADSGRMTSTVLENLQVLSTAHRLQPNASGQPENVPVVNLLVTPEEAELLTLATTEGRIQLVLRNPMDDRQTAQDRRGAHSRDLYFKGTPPPAPRALAAPTPQVVKMEPPPPTQEVEMIRGNRRSVETITGTSN